jgi:hypothetical protein
MFTKARWDKSFIFNSIRLRRKWLERIRDRVQAVPVDDGAHGLGTPEHTGLKHFRSGEGVGHGRADLSYVC